MLSPLFVFLEGWLSSQFWRNIRCIYGSPFYWLERYLSIFATRGTDSGKHFSSLITVATKDTLWTAALALSRLTAWRTTLGLVSEAFVAKELLFLSTEGETGTTIYTLNGLVFVSHEQHPFETQSCSLASIDLRLYVGYYRSGITNFQSSGSGMSRDWIACQIVREM